MVGGGGGRKPSPMTNISQLACEMCVAPVKESNNHSSLHHGEEGKNNEVTGRKDRGRGQNKDSHNHVEVWLGEQGYGVAPKGTNVSFPTKRDHSSVFGRMAD